MKWPWQKKEEEQPTDWSKQYNWYTPKSAESTDWSKQYDWYTPKAEPEPPKPSTMDNIKSTAGQVKDTVTSPTFWEKVSDLNDKIEDTVKKPAKWLGKNLYAGIADYSNAFYKTLQSVGLDKVPGVNKALDYGVKGTEQVQALGGTDVGSQVVRSIPGAAQNMALVLMSGGASTIGQIPAMGGEAVRQAILQMLKNPAFINSAIRSYGSAYGEARDAGASRLQGISAGIQQAIPQAMIEQAGGLEQIPNRAGQGLLKTIGRSALEEAGEEILQYPFEGLAKKATYAPETPVFSVNEQAVINPIQQAQAGLVGGLAGGLLGGGGWVLNNEFNNVAIPNQVTDASAPSPDFYVDPYGNASPDAEYSAPLLLPPGPEGVQTPVTNFYVDPYGNTTSDINQAPLLLPEPPKQVAQTNPEIVAKFAELEELNARISEIENDPMRIWEDTETNELEGLYSQRDKLQNELQGEKYQAVDERFSILDNLDKKSLNKAISDAEAFAESLISEHIKFLKMTSGQGVTQGGVYRDQWGDVVGRHGRTSNNEKWYQDWARKNGYKKLSNKDLREIAIKHLTEGVDTLSAGYIPPNQDYLFSRDFKNYAKMRSDLIDDTPYVANRNVDAPSRVMPGELDALQGLQVQKQSDRLSMLKPPITEPDYSSAVGQVDTPFRLFPGEIDPLSNMEHPIGTPVQTSQETIADALESTQPNILGDTETPATSEPDATERTFDTKFEVETDEGVQTYDSNDFVDDNGRTLETYVNEDPVYRELTESLKDTSSKTDNYIRNIAPEIKDKSGLAYNVDHPQRRLKDVFGKHWNHVKKNYFDPFDKSKGDYAREVITRADKIYNEVVQKHGIKKGSKESAAIQWYGEGERIVGSDKNFMNRLFNPQHETITNESGQEVRVPKMEEYTLDDLKRDFPTKWKDIVEAEKVFRQQYDELIDLINESRKKVYPSVGKQIEDTKQRVRDLTEDINELQGKLKDKTLAKNEANDIKRRIDDMIVKREELTNKLESGELWRNKRVPKRKNYFRHFKELNSGVTGLINIMGSPYQIDPKLAGISEFTKPKSKWASFMQQRGLGDYTADAVGGFLDYIRPASYAVHIDPHITKFRQLAKDIADGTQNTKNANNLILFLNDYANSLAGKTNKFDRLIQDMIPGGRKTFAVINWLNSRARANAVLGNLRSSITQIANMPAGIAEVNDPVALGKGMGETLANIVGAGKKPIDQSDFITERYMDSVFDKFDTKFINKPKQFAAWLLGVGDEFGTRFTWNSAYYKALKDGIPNPTKYADDLTRNVVAGRGIGEVPLMQQSKLFQTFFPFTLEVGNIAHVMKNQVKGKEFGKLITLLVANFLFNGIAESAYGDRPLPDPIDAMLDVLSEDDPNVMSAVGRLGGEVLANIPGGQTIASLWPEYETDVTSPLGDYTIPSRQQLFGDSDPTRYGTGFLLQEALRDRFYKLALPWGGGQLKKTIQGVEALRDGGYIKDDRLRYLTPPTTENIVKSIAFGRSSTPEAREYFENDRRPLSEQQTQSVLQSNDPQQQYKIFMMQREANKIQQQIKDIAGNQNLTMPEKDKRIRELQQKLNELWATE